MKKNILLLIILLSAMLSLYNVSAQELDNFDFGDINDAVSQNEIMPDINFEECVKQIMNGDSFFKDNKIANFVFSLFLKEIKDNLYVVIFLISFSVFGGLITNLESSFNIEGVGEIAFLSIYFVFTFVLVIGFNSCYELAKKTMETQLAFIKAAAPLYTTSYAALGKVSTGAAINTAFLFLIQVCSQLIEKFLFPAAYWVFLLSVVNNASNKIQISKIILLARQTINWILGMAMTVFVGFLSLSGLKGATVDGIGMKAIKYAMGSFVPVVGRLLSDTVDTVISSASLIKNSIGIATAVSAVLICAYPILKLVAIIWLYKLTAGIIEPISDKRLGNLMSSAASSIQIMFVLLLTVTIVMILSAGIIISLFSV